MIDNTIRLAHHKSILPISLKFYSSVKETETVIGEIVSQKSKLKLINPAKSDELSLRRLKDDDRFLKKAIVT
jgi:hypothetical protein